MNAALPHRPRRRSLLALAPLLALGLGPALAAQEPLFTFVQVSDSQPQTTSENQAFVEVLRTIAEGGQAGKLLPRPVDLVLFAGDITWGNTRAEWVAARDKLDTWLTANDIPFLAVPGNHDVNSADTSLYEEFIADSGVWDAGSAAFTGHNGRTRSTGWSGLRFIGVNNSNPGWNTIPGADVAAVSARVSSAAAAGENVFVLCHHPHDEKGRVPLAGVLPNPSLVGYLHGHLNAPSLKKGLAGVLNPNLWDANTNAIYLNRALIYYEVFPTFLRAYLLKLTQHPTALPAATVIPLVHPLESVGGISLGVAGPSHALARATPTRRAPERKLWNRAGSWYGVLWSDARGAYRVQRLDLASEAWVDVGPTLSSTPERSFDVLADGDSVLVASNVAVDVAQAAAGSPGQVQRLVYSPAQGLYQLDGAPLALNDSRTPTLVLARDSAGAAWAGWTRGGSVFVAHTLASDAQWSAPLALASGLDGRDTVALVAGSGRLEAVWSSGTGTLRHASHLDGDAEAAWSFDTVTTQASAGVGTFDVVAHQGRVFVAAPGGNGGLDLHVRAPDGSWSRRVLGSPADALSDPVLVVDAARGLLRLFATAPTLEGRSVAGGGALFEKLTPFTSLAFPAGRGTPVVQDGAHPSCGFATTMRAPAELSTGLVVLASVAESQRYWHVRDALVSVAAAPVAEFVAANRGGAAPLTVDFSDLSSGAPTHWSWDFGDGSSSEEREPRHVYAQPGSYDVQLTASSGTGEGVRTRAGYVVVAEPPAVRTLVPLADALVSQGSATRNFGTQTTLRVKTQSGSSFQSFLRFDLGAPSGAVSQVRLRLWCTDASTSGGSVYALTSSAWSESGVTWNTRPALAGQPLASFAAVTAGAWNELVLPASAFQSGVVDLALAGGNTNSALYSSREGAHPPELVVTAAGGPAPAPVAAFSGSPLSGAVPLAVSFSDGSSGAPSAWSWDFGDGGTSSLRNPTHVYATPGSYTVTLRVSNAAGADLSARPGYVNAGTAQPPPTSATLLPVADARANEANPSSAQGSDVVLRVRSAPGGSYETFLRFDLGALAGTATSARLRLFATDGSNDAGTVYRTSSAWSEADLRWSNRPPPFGAALASGGAVADGAWVEFDVSAALGAGATLDLVLQSSSSNSGYYSSREGAHPPELVLGSAP